MTLDNCKAVWLVGGPVGLPNSCGAERRWDGLVAKTGFHDPALASHRHPRRWRWYVGARSWKPGRGKAGGGGGVVW